MYFKDLDFYHVKEFKTINFISCYQRFTDQKEL